MIDPIWVRGTTYPYQLSFDRMPVPLTSDVLVWFMVKANETDPDGEAIITATIGNERITITDAGTAVVVDGVTLYYGATATFAVMGTDTADQTAPATWYWAIKYIVAGVPYAGPSGTVLLALDGVQSTSY